jgi:hypothetical protein
LKGKLAAEEVVVDLVLGQTKVVLAKGADHKAREEAQQLANPRKVKENHKLLMLEKSSRRRKEVSESLSLKRKAEEL